jgi:aryl-alcohol dehydrogenase-like predicted oxidoreductase
MAAVARTVLPRARIEISRIGLGLAHVHLLDSRTRVALIEAALDLGITHFDTARFYSDGLSERALGSVLGKRRNACTIATKFGLLPTPLIGSAGPFAKPLRKGRSLFNKLKLVPYPLRSYSARTMRRALEQSLRALGTDYVDIYHVHEPLADTRLSDELINALQSAKTAGSVRCIGVSGAEIDEVVERYGYAFDVIQCAESSWSEVRCVPDITHSLFSDAARRSSRDLSAEAIERLLRLALRRRSNGAVIVQTRDPRHLREIASYAELRDA